MERIILFDGVCNFCNSSINFVMDHDPKFRFKFAPLQSNFAQERLAKAGLNTQDFDTVVLLEGDKVYTRSGAALRIAKNLSGAWPLLYGFVIVPPFIRNAVYNWVARNRYRWFGKQENCRLPSPEERARFVGQG
jgi:predicted DCC family thiol-disulfide oxidoreductase YuxK